MNAIELREVVWEQYAQRGRSDLPWRQPPFDPYHILVSELMLQQTQVQRVIPKYLAFLDAFPTIQHLADAPLSQVLQHWQGLGYNRRAKYLHEAAKQLAGRTEPWTFDDLVACTGIGPNTASAVLVYTYNQPLIFIETNVRTVLIHHMFADHDTVHDNELKEQLALLVDQEHPREFYWGLMDYGTHIKKTEGNPSRRSHHYKKQSTFKGSRREIRGSIIRHLAQGPTEREALEQEVANDSRFEEVVAALEREGLIVYEAPLYRLAP